jgi:hypothetical protein
VARRVGVIAIAADAVTDMAALQTKLPHITLVSDTTLAASRSWGLLVAGGEHPDPGTFIVAGGKVTYRRLEDRRGDWPTYAELRSALQ